MRITVAVLGTIALVGVAEAQQRLKETIISDPAAANWTFDGNPKIKQVDAATLPGGKALLVKVAAKGTNPWDIQARMKVKEGVAAGDTVTFGFYARADQPDPGKESAAVTVRVQRSVAPYDAAIEGAIEIGKEWTFHCLTAPSKLTLDAAVTELSVQMAGDKHAVAFGPYMVTKIAGSGPAIRTGLPCGKPPGAA